MVKKLDVVYPSITTYTHHAHLLSILETNENTKNWIFSHYIQLFVNKNLKANCWGDFYFQLPYELRIFECCKWINTQKFNKEFVKENFDSVIKFVRQQIDHDRYVTCCVDFKEIGTSFIKYNYMHDLMVFGYDDEKGVFYCADFLFDRNTKYGFYECTYEDFELAYSNDYMNSNDDYLNNNIYTLELKANTDYEYSAQNIIYWMNEYRNSAIPEYWKGFNFCNSKSIAWGLDYYDVLAKYINEYKIARSEIRLLVLLQDHAFLMCERIKFIDCEDRLFEYVQGYTVIMEDIKKLVFKALRYTMKKDDKVIDEIVDKLKDIRELEYTLLGKMLDEVHEI